MMDDFEPRRRFRYDKIMGEVYEVGSGANAPPQPSNTRDPRCVSDIEPYRAIASDVACDNKRPVIGGRAQHREFLSRNGYTEVGNEFVPNHQPRFNEREAQRERVNDIKRSLGE